MTTRESLAELAASGTRLRPSEAVAVVSELCRPTDDGTEEVTVAEAAQLLHDLLPDLDAPAEYRASGALRLVIARALGTLDLPPYSGLEEFCAALARVGGDAQPEPTTALVPLAPLVPPAAFAAAAPAGPGRRTRSAVTSWMFAAAAAALVALATFTIAMESSAGGWHGPRPVAAAAAAGVPAVSDASTPAEAAAPPPVRLLANARRAVLRPVVRRPAAPRTTPARPRSFFRRELFRIVIK